MFYYLSFVSLGFLFMHLLFQRVLMTLGHPCNGELLSGQLAVLLHRLAMFPLMWLNSYVRQPLLVVIGKFLPSIYPIFIALLDIFFFRIKEMQTLCPCSCCMDRHVLGHGQLIADPMKRFLGASLTPPQGMCPSIFNYSFTRYSGIKSPNL